MKKSAIIVLSIVALAVSSAPQSTPAKERKVLDRFELIPDGLKIRLDVANQTMTYKVEKEAVFEFTNSILKLTIDGSLVDEFAPPKQPGVLSADAIADGALSSLKFYRAEQTTIELDSGDTWINIYARATFATRGKDLFIKFFRKRFKRNKGVRIFKVK